MSPLEPARIRWQALKGQTLPLVYDPAVLTFQEKTARLVRAVYGANKLVNEGVVGVIGHFNSGITIPASPLGKFKMGSQVVAISLLILGPKLGEWDWLGNTALWVVIVAALGSGVDYFVKFWKLIGTEPSADEAAAAPGATDQAAR